MPIALKSAVHESDGSQIIERSTKSLGIRVPHVDNNRPEVETLLPFYDESSLNHPLSTNHFARLNAVPKDWLNSFGRICKSSILPSLGNLAG